MYAAQPDFGTRLSGSLANGAGKSFN